MDQHRPHVFNISQNNNQPMWHEKPDTIQFQSFNTTKIGTIPKTPTQPIQSQTGALYNIIGAVINMDQRKAEPHKDNRSAYMYR
eukprot:5548999-Amphidinium_carterae.1